MVSFENGRDRKSSVTTICTYWFIVEVVNTAELYLILESAAESIAALSSDLINSDHRLNSIDLHLQKVNRQRAKDQDTPQQTSLPRNMKKIA
jgi:hypothetical protein